MRPSIIPVIHYADDEQALRNAGRAAEAGCEGVMLIEMRGRNDPLPAMARAIKARWPHMLVGINFLGATAIEALVDNLAIGTDMTWTDAQPTHSMEAPWFGAEQLREARAWGGAHLLFTGVAFKHQRHEPDPETAARKALEMGFVPTTSGEATGVAAEVGRIERLRAAIGPDAPLAIASGVTPDNVHLYAPLLSHILVATGVSSSFHEFDEDLLRRLRSAV
jgi:predicted TIM-barrel enzyme